MTERPQTTPSTAPPPAKCILLADDDPSVREMIARVLTGEGYHVYPAANGVEALKIARSNQIHLALLDLKMPVMNGWETRAKLANEHPMLPVIIITARPNQVLTALASGVGALLEKPLDFSKLLGTICDLLADPAESRLSRVAGRPSEFHYLPGTPPKPIS